VATVVENIIEGHSLQSGSDGITITRTFIVSDLGFTAPLRLYEAMKACPQRGEIYPGIGNLVCDTISVQPKMGDNTVAVVTCQYKPKGPLNGGPSQKAQIETGSSVTSAETNQLADGKTVIQIDGFKDPTKKGRQDFLPKSATARIQIAQSVYRLSRKETESPQAKATEYVGKINSATFLGQETGSWLCTNISGRSGDGGKTWDVSYEFQFDKYQWSATLAYIDPDTNLPFFDFPAPTPAEKVGTKLFLKKKGWIKCRLYDFIDFNQLGLE